MPQRGRQQAAGAPLSGRPRPARSGRDSVPVPTRRRTPPPLPEPSRPARVRLGLRSRTGVPVPACRLMVFFSQAPSPDPSKRAAGCAMREREALARIPSRIQNGLRANAAVADLLCLKAEFHDVVDKAHLNPVWFPKQAFPLFSATLQLRKQAETEPVRKKRPFVRCIIPYQGVLCASALHPGTPAGSRPKRLLRGVQHGIMNSRDTAI